MVEKPIAFPVNRSAFNDCVACGACALRGDFEDFCALDVPASFPLRLPSATARCCMSSSSQALAERMVCVRHESFQPRISASRKVPNNDQATAIKAPSSPSAIMSSINVNASRFELCRGIIDHPEDCDSHDFDWPRALTIRCGCHHRSVRRFAGDERGAKAETEAQSLH